jgi:hypothetical protein
MQTTKAITHHHHAFLKAAYRWSNLVDLVNDERYLSHGDTYIKFDPQSLRFIVMVHTANLPIRVRMFDNLLSAINCARRVK